MGCASCGGTRTGFVRRYFYVRAGHEVRDTEDKAEAERWMAAAGGAGRIERRVVRAG